MKLLLLSSRPRGFAPDPDNLFVLNQSAAHGSWVGLAVTLGLCIGQVFHTTAVALGLAIVSGRSAAAFAIIEIVGAAHLLYLACGAFRAKPSDLNAPDAVARGYGRMVARGIVMNVTNPQVAIFFLAFLPRFIRPTGGQVVTQIALIGGAIHLGNCHRLFHHHFHGGRDQQAADAIRAITINPQAAGGVLSSSA